MTTATTKPRRRRGSRRGEKFDEKLEELYEIAAQVFSEVGYKAGTTTVIARRAGLTQPALYYYVGNKTHLLRLICQRMGQHLRQELDRVLELDSSPGVRLAEFIRAHTSVMLNEREGFEVYVTEARHLPSRTLQKIRNEERAYVTDVAMLVRQAQESGALPQAIDHWVATQALLGMMNWAYKWYHPSRDDPSRVIETLIELTFGARRSDER